MARKMFGVFTVTLVMSIFCLLVAPNGRGQATISTGSMQGEILDPKGAVVTAAKVIITNKETGQKLTPAVTDAGTYNSGPLPPGEYIVRVTAQGFRTLEKTVTVAVGGVTRADAS